MTGEAEVVTRCSSGDCQVQATTVITVVGMRGHMHDCDEHAMTVRLECAVAAISDMNPDGTCPVVGCTPAPIHTSKPTLRDQS